MEESPRDGPRETPHTAGESRVAATIWIWLCSAGLGGLVWLGAQDPFMGLPLTHPINLVLFGLCAAVGLGFTASIWLSRRPK
jgi:hypothetical protein